MPDERQDSIRQGIHAPEESPEGQRAAEKKRDQAPEAQPIGGGMGGTSDADAPADEALYKAQREAAESDEIGAGDTESDATLPEPTEPDEDER